MGANIGTTLGNGLIALPLGPLGLNLAGIFALVYVFASPKGQEHRAGLHGLCADLLRPEPDDRRPAPLRNMPEIMSVISALKADNYVGVI